MNHVLHQSLLGSILYDQQRYVEVINLAQDGLREVEALATADHPYAASMHQLLANAFLRTDQLQSAESHAREKLPHLETQSVRSAALGASGEYARGGVRAPGEAERSARATHLRCSDTSERFRSLASLREARER